MSALYAKSSLRFALKVTYLTSRIKANLNDLLYDGASAV